MHRATSLQPRGDLADNAQIMHRYAFLGNGPLYRTAAITVEDIPELRFGRKEQGLSYHQITVTFRSSKVWRHPQDHPSWPYQLE
jgi:hypothetical protein